MDIDIIEELFDYFQSDIKPDVPDYQEKVERYKTFSARVADAFGVKFVDEMTQAQSDLDGDWELAQFRAGFRLGALLMLEVLKPA